MRNELLKEALMRAHKTVDDVAQATGVDPKTVYRWLNGRVPHARHRWALAQLLNMREDDLWDLRELSKQPSLEILMPYAQHSHHQPSSLQMSQEPSVTYNIMGESLSSLPDLDMLMRSRRQILKEILSAASAAFVLSPSALFLQDSRERLAFIIEHPSSLDTEALASLSAITEQYWKLSTSASIDLLSGIAGHFTTIVQLLKRSHPTPIYEKLCALASENALLMGKAFYEIREYDLAWEYYKFSLKVARDTQNTELWAAGSGWISLLQIHWGQPEQALPLLHQAQRQKLHDQRLRPWLSAIEAEIQAKLGNAEACLRCLDTSKSATLPLSLADDIYHTQFDRAKVLGYEGACLVLLRQPEQALPVLNESSALSDPTNRHSQTNRLADKGTVYGQLGDVPTACSFLLQGLNVTEQTKSLVGLQRIYKGRQELDPWKDSSEVKNLDERISYTFMMLTKLKEQVH